MFILNKARVLEAMEREGYPSLQALADTLGLHRNTLHYFLSGHRVLPESVERLLETLHLTPQDALQEKAVGPSTAEAQVDELVDTLHAELPNACFILFGSRASKKAKKYSDWDIGVFSRDGIPHETFRELLKIKNNLVEALPFLVDLVNLNRADATFLKNAAQGWQFLTGRRLDWAELQRKARA